MNRLGRGNYFGELALLYDSPRSATVLAVEAGRVFSLDRETFNRTLAHDLATRARLQDAKEFDRGASELEARVSKGGGYTSGN